MPHRLTNRQNMPQRKPPIPIAGRPNHNKSDLRFGYCPRRVRSPSQKIPILANQGIKPRLKHRRPPMLQSLNFRSIRIHANPTQPLRSQAGSKRRSKFPQPDNRNRLDKSLRPRTVGVSAGSYDLKCIAKQKPVAAQPSKSNRAVLLFFLSLKFEISYSQTQSTRKIPPRPLTLYNAPAKPSIKARPKNEARHHCSNPIHLSNPSARTNRRSATPRRNPKNQSHRQSLAPAAPGPRRRNRRRIRRPTLRSARAIRSTHNRSPRKSPIPGRLESPLWLQIRRQDPSPHRGTPSHKEKNPRTARRQLFRLGPRSARHRNRTSQPSSPGPGPNCTALPLGPLR